ncbi:MAG TPA: phage holin family protein, partial [Thermoleophilaceae bacterium]
MRISLVIRAAIVLLIDAGALLLLSEIIRGFTLDGPGSALSMAALVGVLNALVWPTLARLALPLSVLTLGLAALALNGALVALAVQILPRAHLDGVWDGVLVTVGLAAITTVISAL